MILTLPVHHTVDYAVRLLLVAARGLLTTQDKGLSADGLSLRVGINTHRHPYRSEVSRSISNTLIGELEMRSGYNPITHAFMVMVAAVNFPAEAMADCSTIDIVPVTIDTPGHYCLNGNLTFSNARGTAITINSDDVTLDLQGFELRGPHYGGVGTIPSSQAILTNNVGNVTLRNGRISGFGTGVSLASSLPLKSGNLVENLHIDGNASNGIGVTTAGTIIRNNRITNLNGSLQTGTSSGTVTGIYSGNLWGLGFGNQIVGNSITGFKGEPGTSGSAGIRLSRASDTLVKGNYIQSASPSELFWGIWIGHSHNVTVLSNQLHSIAYGIDYTNIAANTSGKYGGNVTERVTFPYVGVGTDIGNNF